MILSRRPTDVMGAAPGRAGLFPALSPAPALSFSQQQRMLDLAALQAEKECIGLYTFETGTTRALVTDVAATPIGGPIGFAADLSRNNAVGPELLGDPDFNTSTYWSRTSSVTIAGGSATIAQSASTSTCTRIGMLEIGGLYTCEIDVASITMGEVRFYVSGTAFASSAGPITAPGVYSLTVNARSFNTVFGFYAIANTVASVTRMSLKRIAGNCAVQNTAANKPVLRSTPISLSNYAYSSGSMALTVTYPTAPGYCTTFRVRPGRVEKSYIYIGATYNIAPPGYWGGPLVVFAGVATLRQEALAIRFLSGLCPSLGHELLTNGGFDTGIAPWNTAWAFGEWDSGTLKVVSNGYSGSGVLLSGQSVGATYVFAVDCVLADAAAVTGRVSASNTGSPGSGGIYIGAVAMSSGVRYEMPVYAGANSLRSIGLTCSSGVTGSVTKWDNVSLRQVF